MSNRLTKIGAALAAVAALAVGGSAIAGAAQKSAPPKPAVSQSQEPLAPDTDNVQQGDQTAPDPAGPSDGPGGHADEPGNANALPTTSSRASSNRPRNLTFEGPASRGPRTCGRSPHAAPARATGA